MNQEKAAKYLADCQQTLKPYDQERLFLVANCYVQLGRYSEAKEYFEKSFLGMFTPPTFWKLGQVNWLVEICVLSGRVDLFPDVLRELDFYKNLDPKGDSLIAVYTYALMEHLTPTGWDISRSVARLLSRPKIKLTYSLGLVLQAIGAQDNTALESSFIQLLKVHDGMAKYGVLRETAEGLVCMPAMALSYAALTRNLKINLINEYLRMDYLKFVYHDLI